MPVRPFFRKNATPGWPVWILFAAWLCANSPQEIVFHAMAWAGNARHFSHQERLKAEATFVLTGKSDAAPVTVAKAPPVRPSVPAAPAELVLKKIDLYVSLTIEPAPPGNRSLTFPDGSLRQPASIRAAPPSPPPRTTLTA